MNLNVEFPGEAIRFEGNRTLMLRQLPAGAQIHSARVTVTPKPPPGQPERLFEEVLTFPATGTLGDFGMTRLVTPGVVEVDFHARRTLAAVQGSNIAPGGGVTEGAALLVDLGGGVFMPIAPSGALAAPDETDLYQVPAGGVLPGLTVAGFRLAAAAGEPQSLNVSQVTIHTVPTHVSVALEGLAPFWTRLGEMTAAETSSDFATFLQLYLNDAAIVGGFYEIPFVLHSDTLARLDLTVAIDYTVQQSALPADVGEVALPYGFDSVPADGCAALQVALPPGAEVTAAAVRVLGSFAATRVAVGPTGPIVPTAMAAILPGQGQAQPVRLDHIVPATAVDLLLSCTSQAAVLDINVLADVDGKPFGDPLLPRPVVIELDRDTATAPTWLSTTLPEAFQFPAGRVWLAVQAREGEAVWHAVAASAAVAEADPIGLHYSAASGLTWRASHGDRAAVTFTNGTGHGALAGLFRLRHVPAAYDVPLEVLVGQGDGATRVSLDRYRVLGRIDFTIDFPEFVGAINRAARAGEAGGAPLGEQLRNGDFALWQAAGNRVGAPQQVTGIATATAVSIAAHGQWAYVGERQIGRRMGQGARLLDLPQHTGAFDGDLPMPAGRHTLAVRADGERIAVAALADDNDTPVLTLIDGRSRRVLGSLEGATLVSCLAWSPDNRLLYVGVDNRSAPEVVAVDAGQLEEAVLEGNQDLPDAARFALEEGARPISLQLSADGRRLYVAAWFSGDLTAVGNNSRIYGFDTRTGLPLRGSPLDVPGIVTGLALLPDGGTLLAVNPTQQRLLAVDAQRLTIARTVLMTPLGNDNVQPMAVVVSGDGRRAYIGNATGPSISSVDLNTWQASRPVFLPVTDTISGGTAAPQYQVDVALTPTGDRLYAAVGPLSANLDQTGGAGGLFYLTLGLPEAWTLTQGFVMPLTLAEPHRQAALFGPVTDEECAAQPARPSALSQAVAAGGGRTYDFSFWGIALTAGATAEVIWRGDGCTLQRTDRIVVQIDEDAAIQPCPALDPAVPGTWPELLLHRQRLVAPEGATQAEIRFITPPGKNAIIDTVSFEATDAATVNGDLLQVNEEGEVVGWQVTPATAVGIDLQPAAGGTQVSNTSGVAASLLQRFAVTAAQPFLLRFDGEVATAGAGGLPRVELHWFDATGAPLVDVTPLALHDGQSVHQLVATTPAGATEAELHLVLPGGAALLVRHISYAPVATTTVPICFVAETPGDITVLGFDYAYDTAPERPVATPATGLCPPTPPGRGPGGQSGCLCAYCTTPCGPCCDDEPAAAPELPPPAVVVRTPPRRPTQPAPVSRPLTAVRDAVTDIAAPRLRAVEDAVRPWLGLGATEWATRAPELAAASAPVTLINGIGPERAAALRELGIDSLPRLATADPNELAQALRGVSPAMANEFVDRARMLLAEPGALPAPLVSCIMPTTGNRDLVAQAIALFQRQTYPHRELIIVDDGPEPLADLIPSGAEPAIRYLRLEGEHTLAQKRNAAIEAAGGPVIAHWDDTAWYAPWRLSYQMAALVEREADVCGLEQLLHYDPATGAAWLSGPHPTLAGGSLCYRRALWASRPFVDGDDSDAAFQRDRAGIRLATLRAIDWYVDIVLAGDSGPAGRPAGQRFPAGQVRSRLGPDRDVYERLAGRTPAPTP